MPVAIPATVEALLRDEPVVYNWFFDGVQTGYAATANDGTALLELDPDPNIDKLVAMSLLVHRWKWGKPMRVYRLGPRGWVRWNLRHALGDPPPSSTTAKPTDHAG